MTHFLRYAAFLGIIACFMAGTTPAFAAAQKQTTPAKTIPNHIIALNTIAAEFPSAIALTYSRLKAGGPRTPRLLPDQKIHYDRLLVGFSKSLKTWINRIQERLDAGLFSPEYRSYYRDFLPEIRKNVYPFLTSEEGLRRFHILYDQKIPPSGRLPFMERYLKADYADEYRFSKVRFYDDLSRTLHQDYKGLLQQLEKNGGAMTPAARHTLEQKIQKTHKKIQEFKGKSAKWAEKIIMFDDRSAVSFALDDLMGVDFLRGLGLSGRGVSIAVLEASGDIIPGSGTGHQDFSASLDGSSYYDFTDHGTHVTGILAAKARTVLDRLGIAHGSKIFYLKAPPFGDTIIERRSDLLVDSHLSDATDRALADQIDRAGSLKAPILNASVVLSLGPKTLVSLKKYINGGGIVVKAAGNGGTTLSSTIKTKGIENRNQYQLGVDLGLYRYIADHPEMAKGFILVGNISDGTKLTPSSNRAGFLKDRYIAAWGHNVPSTVGTKDRKAMTGTSMAAPMVSGSLALLMEGFPGCGAQTLAQILLESASPLKPPETFGRGRLDLRGAYEQAMGQCPGAKNAQLSNKKP